MFWNQLKDENKLDAANLLGLIDGGERWIFEHSDKDGNFHAWVDQRFLHAENTKGVFIACYYKNTLRVNISLEPDLPEAAEKEMVALLKETLRNTDRNTYVWCRNENQRLVKIISEAFNIVPSYASHEMTICKEEFQAWYEPYIPDGFELKDYESSKHEQYIQFLEKTMSHVSPAGTHPYVDRSESLAKYWTELSKEGRFLALWCNELHVGVCYTTGMEVEKLAVDEAFRGRGLGYLLLYKSIKNAFRFRDKEICLYVVDWNENAYRFYLRTGMKVTGHSVRFLIEHKSVN